MKIWEPKPPGILWTTPGYGTPFTEVAPVTGYRDSFQGLKRPGPEVDHLTPPSAAVCFISHSILSRHRHGQLYVFNKRIRMLGIFMCSQFNNKLVSKAGPASGDTD